MKWKYLVQEVPAHLVADWLDHLGDLGWELVQIVVWDQMARPLAIFKGPIKDE